MNKPKISLILVYNNVQETIKTCVESLLNQTFKDFELICVNNGSEDFSENVVVELTSNNEQVKKISFPENVEFEVAANRAIGVSNGDYVCFLDVDKVYETGFISELYFKKFSSKNNFKNILQDKIYRREFLENSDVVENLISDKVSNSLDSLKQIITDYETVIKAEFDKNSKKNIENVSDKIYEVVSRFNQLEKTVYENDYIYKLKFENLPQVREEMQKEVYNNLSYDISLIYEYVNSQLDVKGCELNRIYDEINGNYKYTEYIVKELKDGFNSSFEQEKEFIHGKLEHIKKDLVLRYVSLKRLLDLQLDNFDSKIKALSSNDGSIDGLNKVEVSKILDENLDKIYSYMNKTNAQFYEELSKIYKDLNDKLVEKMNSQEYIFNKKIDELRAEFNQKIAEFKEN